MLTLIFNGSPRRNGDTASLIAALRGELAGEVEEISAYRADISPCVDCRYCWKHGRCALRDDMQRVYGLLARADNVVVASPVYFSELTGRMLDMASRLQVYYAGKRFAGIAPPLKRPKRGAVLLTGGGDGAPDRALASARLLLGCMGVSASDEAPCAVSLRTDSLPAREDEAALNAARDIGRMLSRAPELP